MAVRWENTQHTSFTLWDIDREFQNANEAYEQWQARHRTFSRRAIWACLRTKNQDDALAKALSLGRQVQRLMEAGKSLYGARFEQGDCKCSDPCHLVSTMLRLCQHDAMLSFQLNFYDFNMRSGNLYTTVLYLLALCPFLMTIS